MCKIWLLAAAQTPVSTMAPKAGGAIGFALSVYHPECIDPQKKTKAKEVERCNLNALVGIRLIREFQPCIPRACRSQNAKPGWDLVWQARSGFLSTNTGGQKLDRPLTLPCGSKGGSLKPWPPRANFI